MSRKDGRRFALERFRKSSVFASFFFFQDTHTHEWEPVAKRTDLRPTELLISVFFFSPQDLAFHEETDVSCCVAAVLERVAEKSDAILSAIGQMIKYNIPRFLRLMDVTDDDNIASRQLLSFGPT